MLWEIDIHPADGLPDRAGERVAAAARELGLAEDLRVATARGYLLQGTALSRERLERLANGLLADVVVERAVIGRPGEPALNDHQSHAPMCHRPSETGCHGSGGTKCA